MTILINANAAKAVPTPSKLDIKTLQAYMKIMDKVRHPKLQYSVHNTMRNLICKGSLLALDDSGRVLVRVTAAQFKRNVPSGKFAATLPPVSLDFFDANFSSTELPSNKEAIKMADRYFDILKAVNPQLRAVHTETLNDAFGTIALSCERYTG